MMNENDWTRLARYLAGECSPEEAEAFRSWIEADPERRQFYDEMRAAWEAAAARPTTSWDTGKSVQRLAARIQARTEPARIGLVRATSEERSWSGRDWRWAAIAAAVVLVAGAGVAWRQIVRPRPTPVVAEAAPLREVRTPIGQRAVFKLADGTRVILAPGSVLRYDSTRFGVSTREVDLEGRAFFGVIHDPGRPFLVRTAHAVTEDLGTEFVITDYAEERNTDVVVASGTVAVRRTDVKAMQPTVVLARGEVLHLDTAGRATVRRPIDLSAELAWTEGHLRFADVPVSGVVTQINRWYGIQIRLSSSKLATQRFTGSFVNQPDSVVLRELARAIGARIERQGQTVTLIPTRALP